MPSSSGPYSGHLDPKEEKAAILLNISKYLPVDTVRYPSRLDP